MVTAFVPGLDLGRQSRGHRFSRDCCKHALALDTTTVHKSRQCDPRTSLTPSRARVYDAFKPLARAGARRIPRLQATEGNGSGPSAHVSVVLLAGGSGKRMGAPIPKQYLDLLGQPIAVYSLQVFASMSEVSEIVVVCNPEYRELFEQHFGQLQRKPSLKFAEPGAERQDSVYNGFKAISEEAVLVAIHDSARPLISSEDTRQCLQDALEVGAAVLGVPVKPTIKVVRPDGIVAKTLQRDNLWEVQTPQVMKPSLLQEGFDRVRRENLEVTDDVSIIEALGKPVKLTKGSYTNIKVTTPDDIVVAEGFLRERGSPSQVAVAA